MSYYKLIIKQIPKILGAHGYTSTSYNLNLPKQDRFIEIAYVEIGDVEKVTESGKRTFIPAPSILFSPRDENRQNKSDSPIHRHFTVMFEADYELHKVSTEQILAYRHAMPSDNSLYITSIVPDFFSVKDQNSGAEKLIKKIINAYSGADNSKDLYCRGLLLELLAEISRESIRQTLIGAYDNISLGTTVYVRRANKYISEHIAEKITVNDIAYDLKISRGYLSKAFKDVTGQTLIEYINSVKLNRVRELMTTKHISLKEAGESVGIYGETYLSRIFKKHIGMTANEYRILHNI